MGIIDEIVYGYYAQAMRPLIEHVQNQVQEMHDETQKVVMVQMILDHEYKFQEYYRRLDEEFDENLRCWFKRNI